MRQFRTSKPLLKDFNLIGQSVLLELVERLVGDSNVIYNDLRYVKGPDILAEAGVEEGDFVNLISDFSNPAFHKEHMAQIEFADQGERVFVLLSSFTFIQATSRCQCKVVPAKDRVTPQTPIVREKKEGFENKISPSGIVQATV
jgi:hypothetical protein